MELIDGLRTFSYKGTGDTPGWGGLRQVDISDYRLAGRELICLYHVVI